MNSMDKYILDQNSSTSVLDDFHSSSIQVHEHVSTTTGEKSKSAYLFIKRAMDIFFSALALIVLSPLFLIVAAAIKIDSRGPIFYAHQRVGHNGSILNLYKFRSMYKNAGEMFANFTPEQKKEYEEHFKLDNDPRVTKVGGFLRESSLDELPQLLNILLGNLSLVGPRPVVEKELDIKYGIDTERFLSVKPGLTGYWQVNGRSDIAYHERKSLELYYVDNASLGLDIKILFMTVPAVFKKLGAK